VELHKEHPSQCVGGYQDGTIRMFDFGRMEMILKMKPHSDAVSAITCSSDGRVIISGCVDGLIAINSMVTGMTIRILNDHRGAEICTIRRQQNINTSSLLWLASSKDRRVSIWRADWSKDLCELIDWITFPGPGFHPDGTVVKKGDKNEPPTLAEFNVMDKDMILYTGRGLQKEVCLYSLSKKTVLKTITLTDWALSIDVSPCGNLLAAGFKDRLVKLIDLNSGTFQDFSVHSDAVENVRFSSDGKQLISSADSELSIWNILI